MVKQKIEQQRTFADKKVHLYFLSAIVTFLSACPLSTAPFKQRSYSQLTGTHRSLTYLLRVTANCGAHTHYNLEEREGNLNTVSSFCVYKCSKSRKMKTPENAKHVQQVVVMAASWLVPGLSKYVSHWRTILFLYNKGRT